MDYRQAAAKIKKGIIGSCYIFSGPEDSFKEDLLKDIQVSLEQRRGKSFFLERIDGVHFTLEELLESLRQVNIFSGERLLWVSNPPYFSVTAKGDAKGSSKNRDARSEKIEKGLISYAEDAFRDVLIIFSVPEVDKRKKLVKAMEGAGALVEFPPLKGAALFNWVKKELAAQDRRIEDKALSRLVTRTGEDPGVIKKELEKIVTYIYPDKVVTEDTVDTLVPESSEGNVFKLVEAVGYKNMESALKHLHKMYQQGEHPLVILTMVARQYRLLYQVLLLTEKGSSNRQIITFLKLPPFVVKELLEQIKEYDQQTLVKAIASIKDTDLAIKRGYRDPAEALEYLIMQLIAKSATQTQK